MHDHTFLSLKIPISDCVSVEFILSYTLLFQATVSRGYELEQEMDIGTKGDTSYLHIYHI